MTFSGLNQIFQILRLKPETEYKFHPKRRWRFDFAFPEKMLAVEYEGIYFSRTGKSGHTALAGYRKDCEKYNEAVLLGWRVLRFTADMLRDGSALDQIERAVRD